MLSKELQDFLVAQNKRLKKYYNFKNDTIYNLTAVIKLNEEVGELCQEVLAIKGFRRKDKIANHNLDTLSEEFADVLITTMLTSQAFGIDINKALVKKVEKVIKFYSEN